MPFPPLSQARFKRYRRLSEKRYRKKQALFLIEGVKLVQEALKTGAELEAVVVSEQADLPDALLQRLPKSFTFKAAMADFAELHTQEHPEGIVAVLPLPDAPALETVPGPAFVLEGVRDPGNLGTLLRTADWFGFPAVYLTNDCVDAYNPKVVRAAMGAHFRVQLFVLDDLPAFVDANAHRMIATQLGGEPLEVSALSARDLIVLGSESHGLSAAVLGHPEVLCVEIPGGGEAESLNVSMAGGILAFALMQSA